jgi:tetratricopeptide (TPR) repeat protein
VSAWTQATAKPPSLEVYEEFAAGEAAWPDYVAALGHFERAAALDSTFAMAAIEMSTATRMLGRCARTDSIGRRLLGGGRDLAPWERLMMEQNLAGCRGDLPALYQTARLMRERMPDSPVGVYPVILAAIDLDGLEQAAALLDAEDLEAAETEIGSTYATVYAIVLHSLGRHQRELEVCDMALRRFPSQPVILRQRLMALGALGRTGAVLAGVSALLAMPVDTLYPGQTSLRWLAADLSVHGHDAEAQVVRQRAIAALGRSAPEARPVWQLNELGNLLYDAGRLTEAYGIFRIRLARDTGDVNAHGQVAVAAARLGDSATARREDAWLAGRHDAYDFSPSYFRARIAAVLGRREEAVALLRDWRTHTTYHLAYVSAGQLAYVMHYPPEFAPLRGYPPLEELLRLKG